MLTSGINPGMRAEAVFADQNVNAGSALKPAEAKSEEVQTPIQDTLIKGGEPQTELHKSDLNVFKSQVSAQGFQPSEPAQETAKADKTKLQSFLATAGKSLAVGAATAAAAAIFGAGIGAAVIAGARLRPAWP